MKPRLYFSGSDYLEIPLGRRQTVFQFDAHLGDEARLKCHSSHPISVCEFVSPGGETFLLQPGASYQQERIACMCSVRFFIRASLKGLAPNACRVLDCLSQQTGQERLTMNIECIVPHGVNQTGNRIILPQLKNKK